MSGATPDRRAAFRDGVRDVLPTMPGVAAWGLVTGVAMVTGCHGTTIPG